MARRSNRSYGHEFKRPVVETFLAGDVSLDRLTRQHEISRNLIRVWVAKYEAGEFEGEQVSDDLLGQYEAQIAARTRRGKRHRAKAGCVNILCGAPYGYRYVRKTETSDAYYRILDHQPEVVRTVCRLYCEEQLSINAIAQRLNEHRVETRSGFSRWCRSTVWAMLRNTAYRGTACFEKTERAERQRITRPLRQRGGYSPRSSSNRERPREEWIEIPVPPLVSEEVFALAQEPLERNKRHSPRRTLEPTLPQGMLACKRCGYAFYRTSTRTSKRKLYYFRCLGSDDYRYQNGRVRDNRPVARIN